jgi:hypothetical protein
MTIGEMTTRYQNHWRTQFECVKHELIIDSSRTHGSYQSAGGWVLQPGRPRHISSGVTAPVTSERYQMLMRLHLQNSLHLRHDLLVGEMAHDNGILRTFRGTGSAAGAGRLYNNRQFLGFLVGG